MHKTLSARDCRKIQRGLHSPLLSYRQDGKIIKKSLYGELGQNMVEVKSVLRDREREDNWFLYSLHFILPLKNHVLQWTENFCCLLT